MFSFSDLIIAIIITAFVCTLFTWFIMFLLKRNFLNKIFGEFPDYELRAKIEEKFHDSRVEKGKKDYQKS